MPQALLSPGSWERGFQPAVQAGPPAVSGATWAPTCPAGGHPSVAESSSAGHTKAHVRFSFTRQQAAQSAWGASTGHAMLPVSCGLLRTGVCRKSSKSMGQDVLTQARRLGFTCSIDIPQESKASLLQTLAAGRSDEPGEVLWKLLGGCQVRGCAINQGSRLECRALGQLHQARRGAQERRNALNLETVTDTCAGWYQGQEVEPSSLAVLSVTERRGGRRGASDYVWNFGGVTLEKEGTKVILDLRKQVTFKSLSLLILEF